MNFELYENIKYTNLEKLITISKKSPEKFSLIKTNYLRNNEFFQESLNFLINIDFFKINKNSIITIRNTEKNLKETILELLNNRPDYFVCIKNYLINFQKNESGIFSFKPDRNFLITLDCIKFVGDNQYILLDKNLLSRFVKKEFSPKQLEKMLANQQLLGLAAEKIILNYEEMRIKKFDNNLKLDHISLRDVSAGYDIQSYEGKDKIFIEVKAVSLSNYKFHLSVLEYQTAINLKEKYYIYLLPVDHSKPDNFDIENLLRINDLNKNIFNNKISWKLENDGYIVSKN
jgi:hypothetical protein